MNRKFTCIVCPNGCEIEVDYEGKDIKNIEGEGCKKGKEYVEQELTDPRRNIASSVVLLNGELPLVSVRLTKPVPKAKIFDVMGIIKGIKLEAPVEVGDVVVKNIMGYNSDLIRSLLYPIIFFTTTSPTSTGASNFMPFIIPITSNILAFGTGFVSLTLTSGSSPFNKTTEEAILRLGSVSSCSTYSLPFLQPSPSIFFISFPS